MPAAFAQCFQATFSTIVCGRQILHLTAQPFGAPFKTLNYLIASISGFMNLSPQLIRSPCEFRDIQISRH